MKLSEWPLPYVRVGCARCDREGRIKTEGLIEKYGADEDLFVVRENIAKGGCRARGKEICEAKLLDALLVDAITETDESKVVEPKLLPEAREWRQKLGL